MRKLKLLSLLMLIAFSVGNMWADDPVSATINFGTGTGCWAAHSADGTNDTYTDSDSRVWTRTCSVTNRSGQAGYSQFGNASNACGSLEFSAEAGADIVVSAFSVTMVGASGGNSPTKGTIYLYKRPSVGDDVQLATASVNGTTSVTCAITEDANFSSTDQLVVSYAGTAKAIRVNSLTYTYTAAGGTPKCAAPTFTPNGGSFVGSTSVTLATTTEDADIYYTTDGTTPSTSSTKYTAAIPLSATTTIKAIAVKSGLDNSSVAEKTFTKLEAQSISAIMPTETTEGAEFLLNDVTVTYANGSNVYVKDASGYMLVYSAIPGAENGKVLQGLQGKAKLYNGLPEVSTVTKAPTVTDGSAVAPVALTTYPVDADLNKYVTMENVTFASAATLSGSVNNVTGTFAGSDLIFRNNFKLSGVSLTAGTPYRVVGIVQKYNTNYQVYPISFEEIVSATQVATPTFSPAAGTYTAVQSVTISCETSGASIYYTTNGDVPTSASTLYTSAISVGESMTIKAIAVKDGMDDSNVASAAYTINLPPDPETTCTWDLSIVSCDANPTDDLMQWSATYVTMTNAKGSGTKVTNYYPGTSGKTYTSTRFYNGNILTITPSGKQLTTIVFTATSNDYATALANSTWTNATAIANAKVVTVTATNGEEAVSAAITGTCGFTAVQVNYTAIDPTKPATPTFDPAAGTYTSVQNVELACATTGATIYYTTDGSTPTSSSTEYTAAITVDADMTIKAVAIKDEKSSNVAEAAYVINLPATEETQKTWDLTIDETATASADELTWTATYVDMSITRGTAAANNYYPGTEGKSYTETRIYNGATLTITPNGKQITSIVIAAGNGTPFKNATWTNGVAVADGNTVTVTVSAPGEVSAEFAANAVAYSVTVNYTDIDPSLPVAPTFDPAAGTYTSVQNVELACATTGATIYYTTDGSTPTSGSTEYTAAITVDASMTIKAVAIKDEKVGPTATASYVIKLPLTTVQAVFDEATNIGGTEDDVTIQFNNWVVSGISTDGKNVYVTDGTKGFVIYDNTGTSHGFVVNDKLNGTVACQLKLYNKFAEVLGVTSSSTGLTVTNDGVVTPVATNIADLGAVNTGAPIIVNNVKFDGTDLTDGTNTIRPYNTLFAFDALTENKYYNVTGIYVHYNNTKEIAPRSAADIDELAASAPEMAWYVDNSKSSEIGASYAITVGDAFAPYFETNSAGELTYSSSEPSIAEINTTTGELTLKGVVGNTIITCDVAADAVNNLLADSKSFTLQVKAAATVDNVVIVAQYNDGVEDKWLALKHDRTALEVNYSAGTIYDLPVADQADITWKRSISGDNVTFQDPSTNNYLKGSTGSTMTVAAGETGHYIWHWEDDGFYTTLTSGTLRTPLYQGNAGEFKYYAVSNAGSTSSGGYSELPVVTAAVFASSSTKDLIRGDLSNGKWGTLCPKQNVENVEGATFYQISYLEENGGLPYNMVFDQISGTTLTAGQPYFFIASANEIRGNKTGAVLDAAGAGVNGFYGWISATDESKALSWQADYNPSGDNTYVIYGNMVTRLNGPTDLKSERCYININSTEPSRSASAPMPGRARFMINVGGHNTPTGLENGGLLNGENGVQKVLINGNLYILRGEKMYDATGRLVK